YMTSFVLLHACRSPMMLPFFFTDHTTTEIYTLSLHDALPIYVLAAAKAKVEKANGKCAAYHDYRQLLESKDIDAVVISTPDHWRSEEHTSELQSRSDLVCRLLLEKKKKKKKQNKTNKKKKKHG